MIAEGDLRAGEIYRNMEESMTRVKEKEFKELLPGRLFHNNGSSARHFYA